MKALRSCPLFAGMSEIEIDLTLGSVSHQLVSLPSHEVYALGGYALQVCRHRGDRVGLYAVWLHSQASRLR